MKSIHAILAVTFATLLVTAFSFAAEEPVIEKRVQIKIAADDDLVELDASDLEVGETRQSFTESGKEVLITRTEKGYELTVDGKEIDLGLGGDDHHSFVNVHGDGESKVIVKKIRGGEGQRYAFIHADEDHGEHHCVHKSEGGEDDDFVWLGQVSAAEHLLESGVLDDLDEETRQKILDTLNEIQPRHEQVFVEVHKKIHETQNDEQ